MSPWAGCETELLNRVCVTISWHTPVDDSIGNCDGPFERFDSDICDFGFLLMWYAFSDTEGL